MFLHIGADMEIMLRDIVGIFDIKSIRNSKIAERLLNISKKDGSIIFVSKEEAKSIIITKEKGKCLVIYLQFPPLLYKKN